GSSSSSPAAAGPALVSPRSRPNAVRDQALALVTRVAMSEIDSVLASFASAIKWKEENPAYDLAEPLTNLREETRSVPREEHDNNAAGGAGPPADNGEEEITVMDRTFVDPYERGLNRTMAAIEEAAAIRTRKWPVRFGRLLEAGVHGAKAVLLANSMARDFLLRIRPGSMDALPGVARSNVYAMGRFAHEVSANNP
ncbi:unnamed protein product, partial [Amoebophrya sp. A25]